MDNVTAQDVARRARTRNPAGAGKAPRAREGAIRQPVAPPTCEGRYSAREAEFMHAMHAYKQSSGRMFPTWSEVLEVLQGLGYSKG